jgi:hypothetical protein
MLFIAKMKFSDLDRLLGRLRTQYWVELNLAGKLVVDFVVSAFEIFLPAPTVSAVY